MEERSYWYLGNGPIDVPHWTDVTPYEPEVEGRPVRAPMLFTTRDKAETELRSFDEGEADEYLRAIREVGEDAWNRALDNTPEHQVCEIGEWLRREHLNDSEIEYVMVDHELRSAQGLAADLG
jgi:hypothetical protein